MDNRLWVNKMCQAEALNAPRYGRSRIPRWGIVASMLVLLGCAAQPSDGEGATAGSSSGTPQASAQGQKSGVPETTSKTLTRGKVQSTVERLKVQVQGIYPHDPAAFIQGLVWHEGMLYESTGLYGKSSLRQVDPASGQVLQRVSTPPHFFGEGLALVGDRLIQLTWKAGVAFSYDLNTLEVLDEFGYNGEGWGLAYHEERLWMSDGSSRITTRDPDDFRWLSTLDVRLGGEPIADLNELEFAEGQLYANVWGQDRIVRLDPKTGEVNAVIDASGLLEPREQHMVDVLNGIAYDPSSKTFWLTGKFWPKMFQVTFVPVDDVD